MSGLAAAMTVSRLLTGFLLDRFGPKRVAVGMLLPSVFGLSLLAAGLSGTHALISALLVGIGIGAEFDLLAFLVARSLPKDRFGRLFGVTYSAFNVGAAAGPIMLAWSYNRFNDYTPLLSLLAFAILIAIGIIRSLPESPTAVEGEPQ
jgi:MFS family permease